MALGAVPVDDQYWAGCVFGAVRTDRPQQQAHESAVTAAADDQHLRAPAAIEQHFRRVALLDDPPYDGATISARDRIDSAIQYRFGVALRRIASRQVTSAGHRGKVPGECCVNGGSGGVRDPQRPPQRLG